MADFSGEVQKVYQDYENGKYQVVLTINEGVTVINELIDFLKNHTKLRVSVKKWREKRSLDANSYCWVLCTKIAEVVESSKEEVYEEMLQKYGYLDEDENGYIVITAKAEIDVSKLGGHWKFYKGNGTFNSYLAIKGSSKYDSKEMAHFIDMIVLEAKELGIQTETPDEIEKMKVLWGAS